MTPTPHLLEVSDLTLTIDTERGPLRAVDGVSFTVDEGEIVAIVGESGSGKSATVMTIMGLPPGSSREQRGSVKFRGQELLGAPEAELCDLRGGGISIVFQNAISSLNTVMRVGAQIAEQIRAHDKQASRSVAAERAVELMGRVGIPAAKERARAFPHELSGGMRQRVMIAMALASSPRLLIADEATTALDVSVQAQIISELRTLREETGAAIIVVTHDLGVVADIADRVLVMYAGRVVESGSVADLFYDPQHPYTWGLLGSIPRMDRERPPALPAIEGVPPEPLGLPPGCHFSPRCPMAFDRCQVTPDLTAKAVDAPGHLDRCWLEPEDKRRQRVVGDRIGLTNTGPEVQ